MALIRQTSFAAGELSPTMYGRDDLDAYAHGLRRCRNFFISQHGAAVSRPGTKYVGAINNWATGDRRVRLVPFRYSNDVAFVLAFIEAPSGGEVIVYRNGAQVHSLTSPFYAGSEIDLGKLRYAQVGAVLYLTHPDISPRTLTYGGSDTSWTFAEVDFDLVPTRYAEPLLVLPGPTGTDTREWRYRITQIIQYPDGTRKETLYDEMTRKNDFTAAYSPADITTHLYELTTGSGGPAEIDMTLRGSRVDYGYTVLSWRIYRGRGKVFGFVGEVTWSDSTVEGSNRWLDFGDVPDYTRPPPEGTNPFEVLETDGSGAVERTEDPIAVTFHEGRLVYGGTTERPYTLWMSASDNFLDFDRRYVPSASSSVEITLAAQTFEQIRSVVGLQHLLVFTDSGVWAVRGGTGPIAGDDLVQAHSQTRIGASWREPLVLGGTVLYVAERGGGVRDLAYNENAQAWTGGDVSFMAQHLFRQEIKGWAYAREPWNLVWAVREDGTLLSLQYGKLPAWSEHTTDDGTYEDVCVIPEGDEDAVYLVVRRTVNGAVQRYVERMATRVITDVDDAVCVDLSATYSGAATTTPTGFSHLNGESVYGVADGFAVGPLTVSGGSVTLASAAAKVTLGLRYQPELELLDLPQGRNREKNVKRVFVEVEASRGLKVGEDTDHLSEWKQRAVSDDWTATALETGTAEVRTQGDWNKGGRVVLRQDDATPVTVLGITRDVQAGG